MKTLQALFDEAHSLPAEERQQFKGTIVNISEGMLRAYPALEKLVNAIVHTVQDKTILILTRGHEYINIGQRTSTPKAYTLDDFNVVPQSS